MTLTWLRSFFRPSSSSLAAGVAISVEPFLASCNSLAPEQGPEEWQKGAEKTLLVWSSTGKAKDLGIGHWSNKQVHMLALA